MEIFESGEYFYSIAALFSLAAYLLGNILWLRILLVIAALLYIFAGINLGVSSMVGWNIAYLAINSFHVIYLLLDKSTINLPDETKGIYSQSFSNLSTRQFKKIITINEFQNASKGEKLISEGEITDKLLVVLSGSVNIISSDKVIASVGAGDLIGEMSFISNEPASASAVALNEVKYAYWNHEDMVKLQQKNCHLYNKLISIIGSDLVRKLKHKNEEIISLLR